MGEFKFRFHSRLGKALSGLWNGSAALLVAITPFASSAFEFSEAWEKCFDKKGYKAEINGEGYTRFFKGGYQTEVWLYTVNSSDKVKYNSTIASIINKNPWSRPPYAKCQSLYAFNAVASDTVSITCINQQGARLQGTMTGRGPIQGYIRVIPSRNGLPIETKSEAGARRVLCNSGQVIDYRIGRVVAAGQVVQDRIFLSITKWIPVGFAIEKESPNFNDYRF